MKKGKKAKKPQKGKKTKKAPKKAKLAHPPGDDLPKPEGRAPPLERAPTQDMPEPAAAVQASSGPTGEKFDTRQLDKQSGMNWMKSPEELAREEAAKAAEGSTPRLAAKKAAPKPATKGEQVGSTVPEHGDGELVKVKENFSRANTSAMHTPSDLPQNPPAEATDLPPKEEPEQDADSDEEEAGEEDAQEEQPQPQTSSKQGKKRREKTEAEKAAHARYMKFSRSLKRGSAMFGDYGLPFTVDSPKPFRFEAC